MSDIQTIFDHLSEMKKEQKEIKKEYRDVLVQNLDYEKAVEELEKAREKKTMFEQKAKDSRGRRYERYEELDDEGKANQEMLSDMAMTTLMDGKTV